MGRGVPDVTRLSLACHLFSRMSDMACRGVKVAMMLRVHNFATERLPLRTNLQLAGARCEVSTNSEPLVEVLRHWSASPSGIENFTMQVMVDYSLRRLSAQPTFRGFDSIVLASFGSELFGFDLRRRQICALIGPHTASNERFWNTILLPIALGVMGCTFGVVPMHCACLEWKGQGILIAGTSGAGKSTLSAAMAQYGFTFVSDDWTYISESNQTLSAHGLNVPLKLLPDAKRFFDLRKCSLERALNGEFAFTVHPAEIGAKAKTVTFPKRIFLLQRSEKGSAQFSRIDSTVIHEFFERSSELLPGSLDDARKRRTRVIEHVAALDAWQFQYSGSPHEAANAIRFFLEK